MTEYEVLTLLSDIRSNQTTIIAQIVSLHLAMIVGIFYFLHRSGLRMKLAVLILYSLGYALHLGLIYETSVQILSARDDLVAIVQSGAALSSIGQAALRESETAFTNWVSVIGNISFLALWFGTVYFLFFWKRPKETE